jgi:hypothetical protein
MAVGGRYWWQVVVKSILLLLGRWQCGGGGAGGTGTHNVCWSGYNIQEPTGGGGHNRSGLTGGAGWSYKLQLTILLVRK